ncbi:hypothetical protein [Corynebacterium minutissimum]|uniref:hypothetical protein n=1 Tax=Corynebacterium minutissimum TaxID=38301 RepID=UPI001EF3345D|nr:hypothetical protein [Corynebacterium minutissimum]MCG7230227.1 hypothetical protein [Corynebacterium minutissimum]MCG7239306.1 hypothetical protein [Corynebacterium minutissimum]
MSFLTPAKKSLIAVALVAPLTLTACGDKGEDVADAASSAVKTTTTTKAKEGETSEEKDAEDKDKKEGEDQDKKEGEEKKEGEGQDPKPEGEEAPAEEGADQTLANPFENGVDPFQSMPKVEPIQGQQASQEDIDGINGLVRGMYDQQTMRSFVKYLPDHTCEAVRNDPNSGLSELDYNQIPDVPMNQLKDMVAASGADTSQMEGFDWGQTGVESINDVVVDGDSASATVNVNTSKGLDSSTMRFKRENGNWTFCN